MSPPTDTGTAVSVVHEFFDAVAREQLERVTALFDAEGRLWAGHRRQRVSLRTAWARRFSRLDYTQLTRSLMYRDQDIEVYRGSEASALEERRDLPILPRGDEILVRVRLMERAPAGGERLFGDEVIFLLRPDGDRYKITQMREDFRLP